MGTSISDQGIKEWLEFKEKSGEGEMAGNLFIRAFSGGRRCASLSLRAFFPWVVIGFVVVRVGDTGLALDPGSSLLRFLCGR